MSLFAICQNGKELLKIYKWEGNSVGVSASFSEASARTVVANRYSRKHAVKGAK